MTERRGKGEDSIYFEHEAACRDAAMHRNRPGRWRGEISLGYEPDGMRLRRRVSAAAKAAVQDQLRGLGSDLAIEITRASPASYNVRKAAGDWLADGLPGRLAKTIRKNNDVLEPIVSVIGTVKLRELDASAVDRALKTMAQGYSTAAVRMGHLDALGPGVDGGGRS
jgi:hypothetical protein